MNNLSRLLMSSALCAVCTMVSAQQVNVNGIVKDATGETVIGASVMVKGTKTGTVKMCIRDRNRTVQSGWQRSQQPPCYPSYLSWW